MLARGPARVSFRALNEHHAAATILLTLQTNTAISLDENAASPHLVLRRVRDTDAVSPPSVEIDMRAIRGLSPAPTDIVLGGVTSSSSDPVLTLDVTWSGQSEKELEALRDIPLVGDVRGEGYFHAVELVRDQQTNARFTAEECDRLRGFQVFAASSAPPGSRPWTAWKCEPRFPTSRSSSVRPSDTIRT